MEANLGKYRKCKVGLWKMTSPKHGGHEYISVMLSCELKMSWKMISKSFKWVFLGCFCVQYSYTVASRHFCLHTRATLLHNLLFRATTAVDVVTDGHQPGRLAAACFRAAQTAVCSNGRASTEPKLKCQFCKKKKKKNPFVFPQP